MLLRLLSVAIFCCSILYINKADAQHNQTSSSDTSTRGQKDVGDVFRQIFLKNKPEKPDTVLYITGKIYPSVFPGIGYAQLTGFTFICKYESNLRIFVFEIRFV